jgi:hypothetical protein
LPPIETYGATMTEGQQPSQPWGQPAAGGPPPADQPGYPGGGYGAPPAGYGAPPTGPGGYSGPPVVVARNGMGTAALVIGIFALILCWTVVGGIVLGLLAIIFGAIGRKRKNRGEATNGGAALAGLILGVVGFVIAVVLVAAGATFFAHHKQDLNNLQSCLNNAQTQSARNQCEQDFSNSVTGG